LAESFKAAVRVCYPNLCVTFGDTLDLLREAYAILFEWHVNRSDASELEGEEAFRYMDLVTSLPLPLEASIEDMACFFLHHVMGLAKWAYFEKLEVPGKAGAVNLGDVARLALRFMSANGLDPFAIAERSELCKRFPLLNAYLASHGETSR